MLTYTWSIFRLDCAPSENGLTNVVKVIHWGLMGMDENGMTASINNLYSLPSPTPEAFTDYSTLTEETVVSWLQNSLDVEYLQKTLVNDVASKYDLPIMPLPFPWVKVEEPVETTLEEIIVDSYNPNVEDNRGEDTDYSFPVGLDSIS